MFKKILTIPFILISLMQLSCELPEVSDIDPPIVTMIYPVGGAVLTESVIVSISATDDKEVKQVWYYFDGELMETKAGSIADFELDLRTYQDNLSHVFQGGASDEAGNKGYSVQVVVLVSDRTDITPPDVAITSPLDGQIVEDSVKVSVNAFDAGGIDRVAFFVDGDSVATDNSYPYEYIWFITDINAGEQSTIQAKAFDNAGNWNLSNQVSITKSADNVPPVVTITNPLDGQSFEISVNIVASATDDNGIAEVAFFVDGDSIATDASYPYEYTLILTDITEGSQKTVQAKAFDIAGNWSLSEQVSVIRAVVSDITPPTITLLYPLAGATITGTVTVALDVQDNVGVQRVEFYVDGGVNGAPNETVTSAPWNYDWNTTGLPVGDHTLYFKAYDAAGNVGTNGPVGYTIQ